MNSKELSRIGQVSHEGSLGRVSLLMASGTLVSRILGLLRTTLLTMVVGQSLAADAFGYANTLPNFIFNLLSAGVLNAVLIPQITKAMKNKDGGQDFTDRLITLALATIFAITIVCTVLSPVLVGALSGLSGPARHLSILFAYICMPQIAFYGLYAVLGNVLNTRGYFAAYMWVPALANLVQIVGQVLFLVIWHQQRDPAVWSPAMIWLLAGSSTLGILLQGVGLICPLLKSGFKYRPRFGLAGMRAVSRLTMWTLFALVIQQASGMFLSWVMNTVRHRPGNELVASVAAYQNAFLVFMLPHSLVTVSLLTALFPSLSRAWQSTKLADTRQIIAKGMQLPAVAVIPLSLMVMAMARPIVKVIFVGLNSGEAADLALILAIMAIGTLGFGLTTWQQRYCFAAEKGRAYLLFTVLQVVVQLIFSLISLTFIPPKYAVAVVALGQSVSNWLTALVFIAVIHVELNGVFFAHTVRLWGRLLLASLPSVVVSYLVSTLVFDWLGHWAGAVVAVLVGSALFLAIFIVVSRLLKIREVGEVLQPVFRKLGLNKS